MGYFEGLTNGNFKKDRDGNTIFFPWGILGKGRVLPDEQTEKKSVFLSAATTRCLFQQSLALA